VRIRDATCELHRFAVELIHQLFEMIVGERERGRIERVRGDEVGAGFEELPVNILDDRRLGEHKQVVAALEIVRPVLEALAAECGFIQLVLLDHRAHGAVEDHDAFCEQLSQRLGAFHLLARHLTTHWPPCAPRFSAALRGRGRWRR
jgi:hypothetical protein